MSQLIIQEAEDIDMDNEEEEEGKEESSNFIDDETNFLDQEPSNYRSILPTNTEKEPTNVTLSYEEAIKIYLHLNEKLMKNLHLKSLMNLKIGKK